MEQVGFNLIDHSQPKYVKSKMRGRKLKNYVYYQGTLKQKGLKQVGLKTRA